MPFQTIRNIGKSDIFSSLKTATPIELTPAVAVIGTVGVPACYGGFETLVENLLGEGDEIWLVYCCSAAYPDKAPSYKNARLVYVPINANGASSVLYDIVCAIDAVRRGAKTLLILGVSGALIIPFLRRLTGLRIVTNIDGLEYRREKWGNLARWFLRKSEQWAVNFSHQVVADNQAIVEHVEGVYGRKAALIAYGGDHAVISPPSKRGANYALGLCRIEPENNVHLILESFKGLSVPLKFVGNWNNSDYGRRLKQAYASEANVELLDPVYDSRSLFYLRNNCRLYLHGHSAGGTNPSLVEMMHFGRPIACFDCQYNRFSTENKAYFFRNAGELRQIVISLNEDDAYKKTQELKEIAQRRYTWSVVRSQYRELFESDNIAAES